MALISWAKKELEKLKRSPKRLLPLKTTLTTKQVVLMQNEISEVVLAADLRCIRCQERVAAMVSTVNMKDLESIVVHVAEKKVTLTRKTINH